MPLVEAHFPAATVLEMVQRFTPTDNGGSPILRQTSMLPLMVTPNKPWLNLPAQVEKHRSRGLKIEDADRWEEFLYLNNYYRISGYSRFFLDDPRSPRCRYRKGATATEIMAVYQTDSELRAVLQPILAAVEVAVRSIFAHHAAERSPSIDAYKLADHYTRSGHRGQDGRTEKDKLLAAIKRDIEQSKEPFVVHHRDNNLAIPLWVAVETFSFTTISRMIDLWPSPEPLKAVAKHLKIPNSYVTDVLQSLSVLRNITAHHGRLWNRELTKNTRIIDKHKALSNHSPQPQAPYSLVVQAAGILELAHSIPGVMTRCDELLVSKLFRNGMLHPDRKRQ